MTSVQSELEPRLLLSRQAASASTSAIRDLLDQAERPGMISLAGGLPDATLFPLAELAEIATKTIADRGQQVLQYGPTRGALAARESLRFLFDDHALLTPEQLVITSGSQQGLDLLGRSLIDRGDVVVVSDPDYLGALQTFGTYGARLHPIATDSFGLDTVQLEEDLRWGLRPKCCYLVPHFHNPTGVSISAERRKHLAELSSRYGFVVIEDDPYRLLHFVDESALEGEGDPELTVRLRSVSKALAPGLRVGVLSAPTWIREAVVAAKQSMDLHTSTLTQVIAAEAMAAPWFVEHVAKLRRVYSRKCDVLSTALRHEFEERILFDDPAGGMFLWAEFSHVADTAHWLERCLEVGVCFVPGQAFSVTRDLSSHVRLSFATASETELVEAVDRLRRTMPG